MQNMTAERASFGMMFVKWCDDCVGLLVSCHHFVELRFWSLDAFGI